MLTDAKTLRGAAHLNSLDNQENTADYCLQTGNRNTIQCPVEQSECEFEAIEPLVRWSYQALVVLSWLRCV